MKTLIAVTVACALLSGVASAAEPSGESVLLMNMAYAEGRWQARPGALLPCGGPSKPDSTSGTRSLYRLKSRDGKVLMQRFIENPRMLLVEDPREPSALLKATNFTLRVPINQPGNTPIAVADVYAFEYFENARDSQRPSVVARLALTPASDSGTASCLVVDPFRGLPPLPNPPGSAITPEDLAALIRDDRQSLIRWALERNVTPTQLRTLVVQNPGPVAELHLDKPTIDGLLQEYERAYMNRRAQ
jgi:hypothetical protein